MSLIREIHVIFVSIRNSDTRHMLAKSSGTTTPVIDLVKVVELVVACKGLIDLLSVI